MKTKIILLMAFAGVLTSSCIKDYLGHTNEKVVLTADNYLYEGDLFTQYATEQIEILDALIDKLGQITENDEGYNEAQQNIEKAKAEKADLNAQLATTIDISKVANFPRPCASDPLGKCVPVGLEFLVFSTKYSDAFVKIQNLNGEEIGASGALTPLPGYEQALQYIKIPVDTKGEPIVITVTKNEANGFPEEYQVTRG